MGASDHMTTLMRTSEMQSSDEAVALRNEAYLRLDATFQLKSRYTPGVRELFHGFLSRSDVNLQTVLLSMTSLEELYIMEMLFNVFRASKSELELQHTIADIVDIDESIIKKFAHECFKDGD